MRSLSKSILEKPSLAAPACRWPTPLCSPHVQRRKPSHTCPTILSSATKPTRPHPTGDRVLRRSCMSHHQRQCIFKGHGAHDQARDGFVNSSNMAVWHGIVRPPSQCIIATVAAQHGKLIVKPSGQIHASAGNGDKPDGLRCSQRLGESPCNTGCAKDASTEEMFVKLLTPPQSQTSS